MAITPESIGNPYLTGLWKVGRHPGLSGGSDDPGTRVFDGLKNRLPCAHRHSLTPITYSGKHWAALWLASVQWELSRPCGDGVDFICDGREALAAIRLASSRLDTSDAGLEKSHVANFDVLSLLPQFFISILNLCTEQSAAAGRCHARHLPEQASVAAGLPWGQLVPIG